MTGSDPDSADAVVLEIQTAVTELGAPADSETVDLTELAERLSQLHAGLQGALTELDRA